MKGLKKLIEELTDTEGYGPIVPGNFTDGYIKARKEMLTKARAILAEEEEQKPTDSASLVEALMATGYKMDCPICCKREKIISAYRAENSTADKGLWKEIQEYATELHGENSDKTQQEIADELKRKLARYTTEHRPQEQGFKELVQKEIDFVDYHISIGYTEKEGWDVFKKWFNDVFHKRIFPYPDGIPSPVKEEHATDKGTDCRMVCANSESEKCPIQQDPFTDAYENCELFKPVPQEPKPQEAGVVEKIIRYCKSQEQTSGVAASVLEIIELSRHAGKEKI